MLVARDGRVCVADFGLASAAAQPLVTETSAPRLAGDVSATGALTIPGALMGTPGYMAPEQFRGEATSAATDIFAFCVTAHEALYGLRPFAGDTLAELSLAVCEGEVQAPPRGRASPSRLLRLLRRGLHPDPAQRPASMRALLDALARVPGARRRWLLAGVGAAACAAIAGALALRPAEATCTGAEEAIAAVWSPGAAAAVRAGFAATGLHYAADAAERVTEGIDRYAAAWTRARTEVCEATRVRGEQSERLLDLRMICLDRRRDRLAALLAVLAAADAGVVERGVALVHDLPAVDDCADAQSLLFDEDPQETIAAEDRAAIEDGVASALLEHRAGRYAEARAGIAPALARAREVAGPRLRARALRGYVSMICREDQATADGPVREALAATLAAGDLRGFAEVAACMLEREHTAGRDTTVWLGMAEAALAASGGDEQILAKLRGSQGDVLSQQNRRREALVAHREALELRRRPSNHRPEVVGEALLDLANTHLTLGEEAEGIRLLGEALAVFEGALGPEHPRLLRPLRTLMIVHFRRGELAEARALAERSLASLVRLHGEAHTRVGDMSGLLANVLLYAGEFERARGLFGRAVAIARADPGRPRIFGQALANLANYHVAVGELDAAAAALAEAAPILTSMVAPPHPDLVILDGLRGILALRRGDLEAAEGHLRAAIEMFERGREPGQEIEADIELAFAEVLARRGDARGALELLARRGDDLAGLVYKRDRAAALAVQARARRDLGERAAAQAAERAAAALYEELRPGYPIERELLARWRADHGGP